MGWLSTPLPLVLGAPAGAGVARNDPPAQPAAPGSTRKRHARAARVHRQQPRPARALQTCWTVAGRARPHAPEPPAGADGRSASTAIPAASMASATSCPAPGAAVGVPRRAMEAQHGQRNHRPAHRKFAAGGGGKKERGRAGGEPWARRCGIRFGSARCVQLMAAAIAKCPGLCRGCTSFLACHVLRGRRAGAGAKVARPPRGGGGAGAGAAAAAAATAEVAAASTGVCGAGAGAGAGAAAGWSPRRAVRALAPRFVGPGADVEGGRKPPSRAGAAAAGSAPCVTKLWRALPCTCGPWSCSRVCRCLSTDCLRRGGGGGGSTLEASSTLLRADPARLALRGG
jgi:hypothetical protein